MTNQALDSGGHASALTGQSREVGAVVIGRNEGARLRRCLASVKPQVARVVYVDSGSSDGSVAYARDSGFEVVELDRSMPFSAARARNVGFERLQRVAPELRFVQFIDGDCELDASWLPRAAAELRHRADCAVVAGRRRERFPEASIYNRLCDVEWDTPVGEAQACGGDFLIEAKLFAEVGGFDPTVIAGEEPELCLRLRRAGYRVHRLDCEMTLHDAALTRFGQWWRRAERSGYAFALVVALHFREPGTLWLKELLSIVVWACWPAVVAVGWWWLGPWALSGLALYGVLWLRIFTRSRYARGLSASTAGAYAVACIVGKFAEFLGVLRAFRDLAFKRSRTIIEYKNELG